LPLPGGRGERKKRPKNSTFEPLSTIFVPYLKIQWRHGLLLPTPMAPKIGTPRCAPSAVAGIAGGRGGVPTPLNQGELEKTETT